MSSILICGSLKAETQTMRVALGTSQCVYIDGEKECTNRAQPYEDIEFRLTKNSNGKYFSYKAISTYLGSDKFKVTFTVVKDSLESNEVQVRINLVTETSSGQKQSKVVELVAPQLSDLEDLHFDGEPIVRYVLGYLTETSHSISFY